MLFQAVRHRDERRALVIKRHDGFLNDMEFLNDGEFLVDGAGDPLPVR